MLQQVILYFNTLKYLKPIQIFGRVYSFFRKYLSPVLIPVPPINLEVNINPKTEWLNHDPWNKYETLAKKRFTFLNHTIKMRDKINWEPDAPTLWKFYLHYFNYLYQFDRLEQKEICLDWINNNPPGKGTGWHPYTTSLRIVNWIKADLRIDEINRSLFTQAAYLYRNLEFYHPNNHYLANAKALIFAGIYFKGIKKAAKWFAKGLKIFEKELPLQVHTDGGYFEPSLTCHATLLLDILDILNIIDEKYAGLFTGAAERMLSFLNTFTQPDGAISLFNDSSLELLPGTTDIIFYADDVGVIIKSGSQSGEKFSLKNFSQSGFAVVVSEDLYFAIDYGGIRPAHIPAHSHPGVFNYEFTFENRRFVVDSGTGSFETGDIRNYVRKSFAHNTLTIDNIEQAEVWNSFRVARRYNPKNINLTHSENKIIFRGIFDGYTFLAGDDLVYIRTIEFADGMIEVTDEVTGTGEHKIKSFIHLHPEVEIISDGNNFLLVSGPFKVALDIVEGTTEIKSGYYYPELGKGFQNKVVVISRDKIPGKLIYRYIY